METKQRKAFSVFNSIPDSHLQSPIRPHERKLLCAKEGKIPSRFKTLAKNCPIPPASLTQTSEYLYGLFLSAPYQNHGDPILEWVKKHVPESITASHSVLNQTFKSLGLGDSPPLKISDKVLYWYSLTCIWEDIRNSMQQLNSDFSTWKVLSRVPAPAVRGWYSGSFIVLDIENQFWLLGYDQVMMLTDTILARCNTYILHNWRDSRNPGTIPEVVLTNLYKHFDVHFRVLGNQIYVQLKNWEAVSSGLLIDLVDPYPGGKKFLKLLLKEARDSNHTLVLGFHQLLSDLDLDMHQLAEVYGMFRHFGHPTVDEEAGCKKVISIARSRPPVSQSTMKELTGCVIRQYCITFISRFGRWPVTGDTKYITNITLRTIIDKNITTVNLYTSKITPRDWAEIPLEKELKMDYYIDYTVLLDDKSLAPLLSDLPTIYDSGLLNYKPSPPKTSRRLLKQVMDVTHLSIEEICMMIRNRQIPSDWFIVILHAKERELKLDPRLFAMMVLEMRLYFCTTEQNISKQIFQFFPQQTMTMTEAERDNRLLNFTVSSGGKGEKCLHLLKAIDFKSWNLHWSELSTSKICIFLDSVFGTPNLFNFGHEFFSKCIIALASPLNPPDGLTKEKDPHRVDDSTKMWRNHQGGFEGIMQKLWTLTTIGILLLVEEKTGIKAQIVGQGDNQVCRIAIPKLCPDMTKEEYIKTHLTDIEMYSDLFDKTLADICTKIGLVVKTEESVTSSNVLIYGKDIIVDGVYLAQVTKRVGRIMPDTNDMYPTLAESVATVQTSGMSAAQKSHDCRLPYIMGCVGTLLLITRAITRPLLPGTKRLIKQDQELLLTLSAKEYILRFDPNFGGLPILNPLEFLYRGHPDPITSYTTFLELLVKGGDIKAKKIWHYLENGMYEIGQGDSRLLIENPCSLNIKKPAALTTGFRAQLERFIEEYPKNQELKSMMKCGNRSLEDDLYKCLLEHKPLHLRLYHEVSALTVYGAKRNFTGVFASTRTTKKLLLSRVGKRNVDDFYVDSDNTEPSESVVLSGMIQKADFELLVHIAHLVRRMHTITPNAPETCATTLARQVRQKTWSVLIGDAPIEGITIPHPSHQFSVGLDTDPQHGKCAGGDEHVIFVLSPDTEDPRIARGPYPHFVGSKTREKTTGKVLQLPQGSRSLEAAKRACQLISWCVLPGSSMEKLLIEIIKTRTDIPVPILEMASGIISGGSLTHRLRDTVTKHETLGGFPPNITSCYYMSTDTLGKLSRGQDNYNIHFQGVVHLGYAIAQLFASIQHTPVKTIHLHYNNCSCEERIDDMYIGGQVPLPELRTDPTNPLIYCKINDLDIEEVANLSGVKVVLHGSANKAAATVLLERIKTKSNTAIWGISETVRPSVSTLGIKEITRLGINSILKELAILIYLYYDLDDFHMSFFIQHFPPVLWADLAGICLLPEVYKELMEAAGLEGVTDAYYRNNTIVTAIIRVVHKLVLRLHKRPELIGGNRTFFLTKHLTIAQTIIAWSRLVYILSNKQIDIRGPVKLGLQEYYKTKCTEGPPVSLMAKAMEKCDETMGVGTSIMVISKYPLQVCQTPPESFFGDQLPLRVKQENRHYAVKIPPIHSDQDYIYSLSLSRVSNVVFSVDPVSTYIPPPPEIKKREDHAFRLVGQLSTAWAKMLEILQRENITECKSAICLAEGEGSIHKLISNHYSAKTIYNNLLNPSQVISHRGSTYLPGCYVENTDNVYGTHIGIQTGGDITSDSTMEAIISSAISAQMTPVDLVTCDAEAAGIFSPVVVCKITNAVLIIAIKTAAKRVILKAFTHQSDIIALQLKTLQNYFTFVKMVVPIFSSYEGDEVYLVASQPRSNPLMPFDMLSTKTPKYTSSPDIEYLSNAVKTMRDKRKNADDRPYQEVRWTYAKSILRSGLNIGFKPNGSSSYEKLIERVMVIEKYDFSTPNKIEKYILKCMLTYLKAVQGLELSTKMPQEIIMSLTRTASIKNEMERYSVAYLNNRILKEILVPGVSRNQALDIMKKLVETTVQVTDDDDKVVYTIVPSKWIDWSKKYIKLIWRVYGNINYKY